MKIAGRIIFFGLVGVFVWLVIDRFFISDEARVRRAVSAIQKAVETGDILKLSGLITPGYSDEWGMDKATLLAAVQSLRQTVHDLKINVSQIKVTVNGDHADAALLAEVTARNDRNETVDLTQEIRAHVGGRLRLTFVKTQDGWKLQGAENIKLRFD